MSDYDFRNSKVNQVLRFFKYYPNEPLCFASIAVFALFGFYLAYITWRLKSPRFLYILSFTAFMEVAGFVIRYLCAKYTDLGRFIGSTLFILLAPNALALVNYKAVGEVIKLCNVPTNKFFLKHKFVTWFFFSSDIFAFLMQGVGGATQTNRSLMTVGRIVTLVGLSVQLFFFACFAAITAYIHRNPAYNYHVEGEPNAKNKIIRVLYVTIALLYIRSIYRVAEYAAGYDGPIVASEWAFYVFDTLMITISFVVYSIFFIGKYLPKRGAAIMNDKTHLPTSTSTLSVTQIEKGGADDIEQARR